MLSSLYKWWKIYHMYLAFKAKHTGYIFQQTIFFSTFVIICEYLIKWLNKQHQAKGELTVNTLNIRTF